MIRSEKEMLRELIQYRHLLFVLTWKEIRIRYKQSVMGFLWAILMPTLIVAAGILVQKAFSILSGKPLRVLDVASVSVKALPWAFFVGSIRFATHSLTSHSNLVTKIYFPREVLPLSSVLANLFDFGVAGAVLILILPLAGLRASIHLLWLPLLLVMLILLTMSLGILLSCGNVFFRDVKYIVDVILTFGIFFTPVFFDAKRFEGWAPILLLNPVGSILEGISDVAVLHRSPDVFWLTYAACCSVAGFLMACKIFNKAEPSFAEHI